MEKANLTDIQISLSLILVIGQIMVCHLANYLQSFKGLPRKLCGKKVKS